MAEVTFGKLFREDTSAIWFLLVPEHFHCFERVNDVGQLIFFYYFEIGKKKQMFWVDARLTAEQVCH